MFYRYEYQSTCCNTGYIETRSENDPQVYTTCVQCGQGTYNLVNSTLLENLS